jgi:hypothetical protein
VIAVGCSITHNLNIIATLLLQSAHFWLALGNSVAFYSYKYNCFTIVFYYLNQAVTNTLCNGSAASSQQLRQLSFGDLCGSELVLYLHLALAQVINAQRLCVRLAPAGL